MTDKEKAIVMAHTGICMLTGNKFQIFHKYVEDIMKRPIMTHEIGWLADEIKEKSKADFMALCANESSSENPNNSTTKNDLEVECIDRQATLDAIIKRLGIKNESYLLPAEKTIYQQIKAMPSVTPISKECIDCIAEDKTFLKMDRVEQLLNSAELDDWEVLKKIREVVEE